MRAKSAIRLITFNIVLWLFLELIATVILFLIPMQTDTRANSRDWVAQAQLSFDGGLYTWDDICLWRLTPGYRTPDEAPTRFWGDGPLIINSEGMRGPVRAKRKPEGVKRVLILGGSHPMGMYVNYNETYGAVLERQLNAGHATLSAKGTTPSTQGTQWEVLNASAPGHTSFQVLRYLEKYGVQYAPDIVVSDVGVNDTLPLSAEFPEPDHEVNTPPAWAVKARPTFEISAVYRLLRRLLRPSPKPGVEGADIGRAQEPIDYGVRVPRERHAENLKGIRALADVHGFQVIFMGQVSVDLHGSGRATCVYADREHEPNVDLCAFWQSKGADARRFFADPIHANATGHHLIAQELLRTLVDLRWAQVPVHVHESSKGQ